LSYGCVIKQCEPIRFSAKRRELIAGGLILLIFGKAVSCGKDIAKRVGDKVKKVILPAGSIKPEDFANRCLNCNLCVKNCPRKIIKTATAEIPFVHLDYGKSSYCAYECHKCSEVCPSGAIKRLTLQEKQHTKIAIAAIDEDICVKCGVCAMECPKKVIIKEDGKVPVIRFDECIGCGKCASVCPVKAIQIEPINQQVILI
jgi:Pyruvate/2-oxoacid:ferredoxin oxidoreductase delta subunit